MKKIWAIIMSLFLTAIFAIKLFADIVNGEVEWLEIAGRVTILMLLCISCYLFIKVRSTKVFRKIRLVYVLAFLILLSSSIGGIIYESVAKKYYIDWAAFLGWSVIFLLYSFFCDIKEQQNNCTASYNNSSDVQSQ